MSVCVKCLGWITPEGSHYDGRADACDGPYREAGPPPLTPGRHAFAQLKLRGHQKLIECFYCGCDYFERRARRCMFTSQGRTVAWQRALVARREGFLVPQRRTL